MENMLEVSGALIYYKTRGTGPVLLLLPGGDGDADACDGLVRHLESDFTVVAFDRRGLSRSADPTAPPNVAVHADDAALVLAAVTDTPALVFGTSFGAVIALELALRHKHRVRTVVAHEAPVRSLLPIAERAELGESQLNVEDAYHRDGVRAAMALFVKLTGLDFADREPDTALTPPGPGRIHNLEFFLTHDAPAVREYQPDPAALRAAADTIVPAVGSAGSGLVPRCSRALAELLDIEVVEFPGGHNAPMLRPRAFAHCLRETLALASTPSNSRTTSSERATT